MSTLRILVVGVIPDTWETLDLPQVVMDLGEGKPVIEWQVTVTVEDARRSLTATPCPDIVIITNAINRPEQMVLDETLEIVQEVKRCDPPPWLFMAQGADDLLDGVLPPEGLIQLSGASLEEIIPLYLRHARKSVA